MKKSLVISSFIAALLIVAVWVSLFKKNNKWDIMDGPWMINEDSSYNVDIKERWDFPWEDIYIYDNEWNLVLSLEDESQPQYFYVVYGNFIVLDSWTSASQRDMLVYDIKSWNKIFETDYYPWENGLLLNDDTIEFYKRIDDSLLSEYTLPQCESEYDNGYIENYGYTIWEDQANDLGDIQCAYFE